VNGVKGVGKSRVIIKCYDNGYGLKGMGKRNEIKKITRK
jgi:hypothetical protein